MAVRRRGVPPSLAEHAASYAAGRTGPVTPRDAATVVLLRDGDDGVQAYLLRRRSSMSFAAGMHVFPGGGVDPADTDADIAWAGPDPQEWARRLGATPALARALVAAAVRETFEESGVLLAGASRQEVVGDVSGDDWEADRVALEGRELSLSALLRRRGLVLRSDLLAAWAHWITPEFEPRRYDTRFFAAVVPAGQRIRPLYGEADQVGWVAPGRACDAADAGEMAMLPPTYVTCREVAALSQAADALTAVRVVRPVLPRLVEHEGTLLLETDE